MGIKEFEQIYTEYFSDVFNFILSLCGNRDVAEELTQDTFLCAYRSAHRYNGSCTLYTWLCAIAKNTWFHYLRKHRGTPIDIDTLADKLFSDEPSPQRYAELKENLEEAVKAVNELKPKQRDVFWLRAAAELSFARIAEIMQITENSAKVIYFRAKNQLREKLINKADGFSDD